MNEQTWGGDEPTDHQEKKKQCIDSDMQAGLAGELDLGSTDVSSALLSLQMLCSVDTVLVTLSLTINETSKWLSSLPIL